jgi:hypothetical protein
MRVNTSIVVAIAVATLGTSQGWADKKSKKRATQPEATAQQGPDFRQIDLLKLMSAQQAAETGVAKLTAEEKAALNNSLGNLLTRFLSEKSRRRQGCSEAIETNIDGDFKGWEGETIYKLQNGEIWQQAAYTYTYHYAYSPSVVIYLGSAGCMMKVDGVDRAVAVKRIK